MIFVITGPPGAGKGTQARKLSKELDLYHISTGNIFREIINGERQSDLSNKIREYVLSGKLVPDKLVVKVVEKELEKVKNKRGVLLDGFPRTLKQAKALGKLLGKQNNAIDLVLKLEISKQVALDRILERGRKDDEKAKIEKRFDEYNEKTKPIFSYYKAKNNLETIDGEQTREEVFQDILSVLKDHSLID